ncbi:ribonuclease III domain-containing protein, partial [Blyttiomyces helicus]
VAEEGIDIPEWYHGGGRLRLVPGFHIYSKYVVRFDIERGTMNLAIIEGLLLREKDVKQYISAHTNQWEDLDTEDSTFEPLSEASSNYSYSVTTTGAVATVNTAIPTIEYYCSIEARDVRDNFTPIRPDYAVHHLHSQWIASLTLPGTMPADCRVFVGWHCDKKNLAKGVVALEAVKKLHQVGLLDDHLKPAQVARRHHKRDAHAKLKEDLLKGLLSHANRGRYKKREHLRKIPAILQARWVIPEDEPLKAYLSVISSASNRGDPVPFSIGILTLSALPSTLKFTLMPHLSEVNVTVMSLPSLVTMTAEKLALARAYSDKLLDTLLKKFELKGEYAYYVVPIAQCDTLEDYKNWAVDSIIDWDGARWTTEFIPMTPEAQKVMRMPEVVNWCVKDSRHYGRYFLPREYLHDKGPFDEVPFADPKFKCAADWYLIKARGMINPAQPVIRANLVCRKLNMHNTHNTLLDDSKMMGDVFLIPQYCEIHPFRVATLDHAAMIPSILYHIEMTALIEELRVKLDLPVSNENLMMSMTAPSATMAFDYERLETLGDAFLKAALTLDLFIRFPNYTEGIMSMQMSDLQSNRKLFELAKQAGIPGYVIATQMSRKTWKPLTIDGDDPPAQFLSDKQVADTVEALFGACLLSGNVPAATRAFSIIYGPEFKQSWDAYLPFRRPRPDVDCKLKNDLIDFVEDRLGYTFEDRSLCVEAFKHPSSIENPLISSFQRLEFLGDAILGFLAVRYFFDTYPDLPPGRLVDLKNASVNNAFLACVAVHLGFHAKLEHASSPLANEIDDYLFGIMEAKKKRIAAETRNERRKAMEEEIKARGDGSAASAQALVGDMEKIEVEYWNDVAEPKAISDVFEAVLGAVFLDSKFDPEAVWSVMRKIWKP